MSQINESVVCGVKGSASAVRGWGTSNMSDSSIACQPLIEEPSNPSPSTNADSSKALSGIETCCQRPSRSTNLRSTILVSVPSANSSASFGAAEGPTSRYCLSSVSMSDIGFSSPLIGTTKKAQNLTGSGPEHEKRARTYHVLRPHCLDERLRRRFVYIPGCRVRNCLSNRAGRSNLGDGAWHASRRAASTYAQRHATTRVRFLGFAQAFDGGSEFCGQGNDEESGDFGSRRAQARARERAGRRRTDGPALVHGSRGAPKKLRHHSLAARRGARRRNGLRRLLDHRLQRDRGIRHGRNPRPDDLCRPALARRRDEDSAHDLRHRHS